MRNTQQKTPAFAEQPVPYEPPRVDLVLTPGELEREVLYAGGSSYPSG